MITPRLLARLAPFRHTKSAASVQDNQPHLVNADVKLLSVNPVLGSSDPNPRQRGPTQRTLPARVGGKEGDNGFRGKIGHIDASLRRLAGMLFFSSRYIARIKKPHPSLQKHHSGLCNRPQFCKIKKKKKQAAQTRLQRTRLRRVPIAWASQRRMGKLRTRPCWSAKRACAAKR